MQQKKRPTLRSASPINHEFLTLFIFIRPSTYTTINRNNGEIFKIYLTLTWKDKWVWKLKKKTNVPSKCSFIIILIQVSISHSKSYNGNKWLLLARPWRVIYIFCPLYIKLMQRGRKKIFFQGLRVSKSNVFFKASWLSFLNF